MDTGIEGLSAIEYKEKMATAHVKKLKQEQEELENRKSELLKEQATKETEIAELEVRRIEKQKALDAESGSALKSGLANIFGKGKYAEIERENSRLQSEINTFGFIHFALYLAYINSISHSHKIDKIVKIKLFGI